MKFIVATVALVVFISAVYADDKPEESTMVSVGDCEISQVLGGEPLYFAGERNSQNKFERIVRFPEVSLTLYEVLGIRNQMFFFSFLYK